MINRGDKKTEYIYQADSRRVALYTLGCKLNYSESSTIARQFGDAGFTTQMGGEAKGVDLCVINTCSVTESANKKCRTLIRRLVRENPSAVIVVTGCYAQLKPEELATIQGVDVVVGNNNKGELFDRAMEALRSTKTSGTTPDRALIYSCEEGEIIDFFSAYSSTDRTRAFLKIQDGCSYRCSYCTIPIARGESRSISIAQVVESAKQIAKAGLKEIVLTGINTGDFGRTTGERFTDLLLALEDVEGVERYRISSIEPNLLSDEVIEITRKSKKFQPHFHIPLQSGSDHILALMKRRYTTAVFEDRVAAVRRAMPDAFIGIDVIVGFPGESEEHFDQTFRLLSKLKPSYLHIFPYSERPGTAAIELPDKVSPQISTARVRRLGRLSDEFMRTFTSRFIGKEAMVLFESAKKGGEMSGFTENYIRVFAPYDRNRVDRVSRVMLTTPTGEGDARAKFVD